MLQKISEQQKNILEVISEEVEKMKTENDVQYALKGLLAELGHLATGEYFDPSYVSQKASLIKIGMDS